MITSRRLLYMTSIFKYQIQEYCNCINQHGMFTRLSEKYGEEQAVFGNDIHTIRLRGHVIVV